MNMKLRKTLEPEGGVTRVSLSNAETLIEAYGRPTTLRLYYDPIHWYMVTAVFYGGVTHTFSGFSWGYSGEGPRGLETFFTACGVDLGIIKELGPAEEVDKTIHVS